MNAGEKMAERARLFGRLVHVDEALCAGWETSYRSSAAARELLSTRRAICDEMLMVGYQPWRMPVNIEESEAV